MAWRNRRHTDSIRRPQAADCPSLGAARIENRNTLGRHPRRRSSSRYSTPVRPTRTPRRIPSRWWSSDGNTLSNNREPAESCAAIPHKCRLRTKRLEKKPNFKLFLLIWLSYDKYYRHYFGYWQSNYSSCNAYTDVLRQYGITIPMSSRKNQSSNH